MALTRSNVQDFIAQVRARTNTLGTIVYVATLNSDGSVLISRNGVTIFPKVLWYMGTGSAITDTNISGDTVTTLCNDGTTGRGDAQLFINSLI